MTRNYVTAEDVFWLRKRLTEDDGEAIARYLQANAPVGERGFFDWECLHETKEVVTMMSDRMLSFSQVADAIEKATGKVRLIEQWFATLGRAAPSSSTPPGAGAGAAGLTPQSRAAILGMLTPDDKGTVLMAAGIPFGRAATVASKGPADFWATLEMTCKTTDPAIWQQFPACARLLGLSVSSTTTPNIVDRAITASPSSVQFSPKTDSVAPLTKKSKLASAYNKLQATQEVTCREFFTAKDGSHAVSARELVSALDESGLWEMILADEGLTADPEVAAEIVQWQTNWRVHELSPTKQMLDALLDTPWGSKPMKEIAEYLMTIGAKAPLKPIMEKWLQKVENKLLDAQKAGAKRFDTAKSLNEFFIGLVDDDNVFTAAMVPQIVAKLQADHIVTTKLLTRLSDEDLKSYGLKTGQVICVRDALEALSAKNNSSN